MNSLYDFIIKNTSSFVSTQSQFDNNANSYFICSFDVTNLYTNISLQETIYIILNYLLFSTNNVVLGLSSKLFSDLLQLPILNSFFVFNQKLYRQIEGRNGPTPGSDLSKYFYVLSRTEVAAVMPWIF